jgi:hypothetical protein
MQYAVMNTPNEEQSVPNIDKGIIESKNPVNIESKSLKSNTESSVSSVSNAINTLIEDTKSDLERVFTEFTGEDIKTLEDGIREVISRVLSKTSLVARDNASRFLARVAIGWHSREVIEKTGIDYHKVTWLRFTDVGRAIYDACYAAGWQTIKEKRLVAAHARAVEGWQEPVYQQGKLCGSVPRYDGRLLEMLVKGDHPQYADRRDGVNAGAAGGVSITFNLGVSPATTDGKPASHPITVEAEIVPK